MDFLGDLGRRFSHAARSVTERTRESMENSRMSADLRAARSELEARLAELGRAYYDSMTVEGCIVPEAMLVRVQKSMAHVEALSGQRGQAYRSCRCASCGSVQSLEARFCSGCGKPMPELPPVVAECDDAEYCANCGAMRRDEARFCDMCGAAFGLNDEALPVPSPAPLVKPEPPEEPDCTDPE